MKHITAFAAPFLSTLYLSTLFLFTVFLFIVFLFTLSLLTVTPAALANTASDEPHDEIPGANARPQIVKVTPSGIVPHELNMQQSDSVVFFYNNTVDDLISLEIDFGKNAVHCSAAVKIIKEPGLARTRKPFGPKEFASTCFHEKGRYPYKVFTSQKGKAPLSGTVIVQ